MVTDLPSCKKAYKTSAEIAETLCGSAGLLTNVDLKIDTPLLSLKRYSLWTQPMMS
jgi:hypothetical protein